MTTKHPTSNAHDRWPADPPDPEVRPVRQRAVRSAAAKLHIVQEYESYPAGDPRRGALLRREGIYTSHISKWRKLRDRAALQALTPQPPGPLPAATDPVQQELARLRSENARLQARLTQAETVIEVQKKLRSCLGPIAHRRCRTSRDDGGGEGVGPQHGGGRGLSRLGRAALELLPHPATARGSSRQPG